MSTPVPAALQPDVLDRAATPAAAAALWGAEGGSLEHVLDGASFTYRFRAGGRQLYLRLTPPGWQSHANLLGEASYIEKLHGAGISVARPVPSVDGEVVEPVIDRGNEVLAMAFEEAPGVHVPVTQWGGGRARCFGRLLAEVHNAAPDSLPEGQARRSFDGEVEVTRAWLPETELDARSHLGELQRWAIALPRSRRVYGLVHFDLSGDNVLWSGGEPAVIDFDDCMFTWYAADISRTLGWLFAADVRRFRQLAGWVKQGYIEVRSLDQITASWLPRFIRLNAIGDLAWCLYSRSRGLDIEDASEETERHLRTVIAAPEGWTW